MAKTVGKYALTLDDADGVSHTFLPGEEVPGWVEKAATNPFAFSDGSEDDADPVDPIEPAAASGLAGFDSGKGPDGPPPQSGKGSGEPNWRAYAEDLGVDVSDLEDRGDIIARLKDEGHPV